MRYLNLNLADPGDLVERTAWPAFLRYEFPQYQEFWQTFVVGLTERGRDPLDIGFRPQHELDGLGRPEWHVAVAQLHYTMLLHLVRVFSLRQGLVRDRDSFIEAIARLYAATDAAFELLGRCVVGFGHDNPWDDFTGKKAREEWLSWRNWCRREKRQQGEARPLERLRIYRNALLHGRVRPEHRVLSTLPDGSQTWVLLYPSFETVSAATDWRRATLVDAVPADMLVDEAWSEVLDYLRRTWHAELLPTVAQLLPPPHVTERPSYLAVDIGPGAVAPPIAPAPQAPTPGSATFVVRDDPPTGD